jgi:ATP-dependent DNA helicase RecG
MNDFEAVLEKLETPLIFSSKNSFKNLFLVKDLGATMSVFLCELKNCDHQLNERNANIVSRLENMFRGFDSRPEEDKRNLISDALKLIEDLKESSCDHPAVPSNRRTISTVFEPEEIFEKISLPVQYVKGVGPKMALLLGKKALKTVEDMLYFLPRGYEDRRSVRSVSQLRPGQKETVVGNVIDAEVKRYRYRKVFEVTIDDGTGLLRAKWFRGNLAYLQKTFVTEKRFILTGNVKVNFFFKEMIHPDFEKLDKNDDDGGERIHFKRIVPIYSETEGLHQKYIRRLMAQVVNEYADCVISPIPDTILERHNLPDIGYSFRNVHFPDSDQGIEALNRFASASHRRLVFDEFFFFEIGMALKKESNTIEEGISFKTKGPLVDKFYGILPFELTGAQKRVIGEIEADMRRGSPMNRMLQGDVGSGKTVVAMVAMTTACESGYQSAIMAPTEILASQHHRNIKNWSDILGLKSVLLTGTTKTKERNNLVKEITNGDIDIVVGTHALIQEGVIFKKLGFIVIDEQHRFGVIQRATLREKGMNPDVLVMTATPIPRTLAMTVYGDLDISLIDEMPSGKKEIKTRVFFDKDRHKVYEAIRRETAKGNQTFIVYPLAEESENLDLKDATTMARHLQSEIFPDRRVGLIHGKMKGAEKEAVMAAFLAKNLDILVSTTVIEVGIDIPSASLMIIEHAERFGLSQLHQLRGRVGRGTVSSYCILIVHHHGSEDARRRLRIMEKTNDGFKIAEEDLSIRGPGEFMGIRQSGLPDFRLANIVRDAKLLTDARKEAFRLIADDPCLERPEHDLLKKVLMRRWKGRLELARTG